MIMMTLALAFASSPIVEVCENDFLVPILFLLPSNHSHSHPFPFPFPFPLLAATTMDYLKAEKYVFCVEN